MMRWMRGPSPVYTFVCPSILFMRMELLYPSIFSLIIMNCEKASSVFSFDQVHRHEYPGDHHRRMWNDELVLKCQHDALVPAFDPRPGRTNIQQTQDIEIPTAGTVAMSSNS